MFWLLFFFLFAVLLGLCWFYVLISWLFAIARKSPETVRSTARVLALLSGIAVFVGVLCWFLVFSPAPWINEIDF